MKLFYFSSSYLYSLVFNLLQTIICASPFPHLYIDNFLPFDVASSIHNVFPSSTAIPWIKWGCGPSFGTNIPDLGTKLGCSDEEFFPDPIRHIMIQFNSSTFLIVLEKFIGNSHLIPDPSFNDCGMHSTGHGGR